MVKIRLMRVGKRKQPSYRVVVADARQARDGRIIEAIGQYQPRLDPSGISVDTDRAVFWLRRGAQPTDQVRKLLHITGAWAAFKGESAPAPSSGSPGGAPRATRAASVDEEPASGAESASDAAPEAEDPDENAGS
ncbi:MAG: 30S ribosomal protein S16 [Actinobacteria bacterium]|nr:30S ribosomal protein S16 [Actinomycetota bacterium]